MSYAWDEFEAQEQALVRDAAAQVEREAHNFCDLEGAKKLKAKIEAHWRERGFKPPEIKLINVGFHPGIRAARYDLRSNMQGGLPIERLADGEVAQ